MAAASYMSGLPAEGAFGPSTATGPFQPGISSAPPPASAVPPAGTPAIPGPGLGPSVSFAQQVDHSRPATFSPFPPTKQGIKNSRTTAEFALREYISLQRRRYQTNEVGIDERLRIQAAHVVHDLGALRRNVADIVKEAETHRWRRWFAGGFIASFIPVIRTIFRRPAKATEVSNDTEYAFRKSRSLLARIRRSVHGTGRWASIAFFVFAVLYVFSNEVSLRVARTVGKRLKRLSAKIERGEEDVEEQDLKVLSGWRWRIMLWNE